MSRFPSRSFPSARTRAAHAPLRATLAAFLCASSITSASCGSDSMDGDDAGTGNDAGTGSDAGTGGTDAGTSGATFTAIYNSAEFKKCSGCHAPGAPGKVEGTESTQDWSSRDRAYTSLKGMASGLIGNFEGCNGVPLLGPTPANSLLVAALDEDVRGDFALASHMDCNADAISDMTLKIGGPLPSALLTQLKAWVSAGAPNN